MSCDPKFLNIPRNWAVRFLPYAPDSEVESKIGYPNPNKGHGYGEWVEFYAREDQARNRFKDLQSSGAVERMELRKKNGSMIGALVEEWVDGR